MSTKTATHDLLQAIHDALDVPWPATMEDWELLHGRVLSTRAAQIRGVLASVLEHGTDEASLRGAARNIRAAAAQPLPYEPERKEKADGG